MRLIVRVNHIVWGAGAYSPPGNLGIGRRASGHLRNDGQWPIGSPVPGH